jgi:hypothetical protein
MTEISAISVSDVHGIIQNYEIENNSKFRVVKKDVNFGNDGHPFNRVIVPYEISKVNFRVETKILVRMSEEN